MASRKNEARWIESRGRWQINVQVDGNRRTFTSATAGRKGKIDAERKADQWLREGTTEESTRCSVLLDRYVERLKATTSHSNWHPIESHVSSHISPVIGHRKISQLTEQHLQDVLDTAYTKHLSARTLRNIRAAMMGWLKYCRKSKLTTLRPEDLTIPAGAKRSQKSVATKEDLRTLFASDQTTWRGKVCTDRYIHAYRLAVLIGLRPGELLGLRWSDVHDGSITINQSYNTYREITPGKNENAHRTIILGDLAQKEIDDQREMLQHEHTISPYVFPFTGAKMTTQDTFRSFWNRYKAHNGLSDLTPYEMRHTFVSVTKEMPEGLKKLVVGHSQDMDTEGTYGHAMEGDLQAAAGYADDAFRKILGTR